MSRQQKRSQAQEKKIAQKVKGDVVQGSGCGPWHKSDVKNVSFRFEAKYTDKKSYSVTRGTWEKIKKEARAKGQIPALVVDMDHANRESKMDQLVVMRMDDFVWMADQIEWEAQ